MLRLKSRRGWVLFGTTPTTTTDRCKHSWPTRSPILCLVSHSPRTHAVCPRPNSSAVYWGHGSVSSGFTVASGNILPVRRPELGSVGTTISTLISHSQPPPPRPRHGPGDGPRGDQDTSALARDGLPHGARPPGHRRRPREEESGVRGHDPDRREKAGRHRQARLKADPRRREAEEGGEGRCRGGKTTAKVEPGWTASRFWIGDGSAAACGDWDGSGGRRRGGWRRRRERRGEGSCNIVATCIEYQ